ncbi:hypothetical protein Ddc_24530 [Ditylenchus destructor]|nr:hypothetical protein Ddc_24530 [Ditylenchus destructor]
MLEKHKPADLWKGIEDTLDVKQMEKDKVKYIMMNEEGEVIGGEYALSALPTKDNSTHKITVARHEDWPKKKSVRFCSEKATTANAKGEHVPNCRTLKFQDGEHVTDIVVPRENYRVRDGLRKDFRTTLGIKDEEEFTMEQSSNASGKKHVILAGSLLLDEEFEKNKWVIRHGSTSSKTKQPYYAACLGKPYKKAKQSRGYYDDSSSEESVKETIEKMCVTLTLSNGSQLIDLSVESTANVFDLSPIIKEDLKLKRVENMKSFFLLRWNTGELGDDDRLIEVVKDYTKTSEWNVDPGTIRYIIP